MVQDKNIGSELIKRFYSCSTTFIECYEFCTLLVCSEMCLLDDRHRANETLLDCCDSCKDDARRRERPQRGWSYRGTPSLEHNSAIASDAGSCIREHLHPHGAVLQGMVAYQGMHTPGALIRFATVPRTMRLPKSSAKRRREGSLSHPWS